MSTSSRRNNISRDSRHGTIDNYRRFYFCDWESNIGYGIAIFLSIFEAKRLLIIILELFINWNVIRMAGGYQPVIFSIIDIFLGFIIAIKSIITLRNIDRELLNSTCKRTLKCLLFLIIICILMNILTLVTICYNVSVKEPTLANIFNNSMNHYVIDESDKLIVDQIQFDLQCCGHSNYSDWFLIKWRIMNNVSEYDSIDGTNNWSVPFSCCSIKNFGNCANTEILKKDNINTINNQGCAGILSDIILKILCIAYAMGIIIIVTQIFLAFCLVRMLMKCFREYSKYTIEISQSSLLLSEFNNAENDFCPSKRERLTCKSLRKKLISSGRSRHCYNINTCHSDHEESSLDSFSNFQVAQINPSIHLEHRVPQQ
ncbi:hypothetical protein PV327_000182 [Microctonus hyperodae]|uniref:Tetraspanin n=1 Tax=Microctonus hyperodae TaxID=165561 RepID=A0AA39G5Z0_MICHY|nr:hypothetical protein PV327_000182 [Microctonus hyperodae]